LVPFQIEGFEARKSKASGECFARAGQRRRPKLRSAEHKQ